MAKKSVLTEEAKEAIGAYLGEMMKPDELSDATKRAINRHLWKAVLPTGVVATVLAFLLGFFVNEVARSTNARRDLHPNVG